LTTGTIGLAYAASVSSFAGGGQTPYTFTLASGSSLPPGLSPLNLNGAIVGCKILFSIGLDDRGRECRDRQSRGCQHSERDWSGRVFHK
jgi:hypothetical protein